MALMQQMVNLTALGQTVPQATQPTQTICQPAFCNPFAPPQLGSPNPLPPQLGSPNPLAPQLASPNPLAPPLAPPHAVSSPAEQAVFISRLRGQDVSSGDTLEFPQSPHPACPQPNNSPCSSPDEGATPATEFMIHYCGPPTPHTDGDGDSGMT